MADVQMVLIDQTQNDPPQKSIAQINANFATLAAAVGGENAAPQSAVNSISTAGALTMTAAEVAGGAQDNTLIFTGTNAANEPWTLPTVAQCVAELQAIGINPQPGYSWMFTIVNHNVDNETLTLTADAGPTWTLTGTATVAQGSSRSWVMTLTSLTAGTAVTVGTTTVGA